jgi:hypothetical protein
VKLLSLVIIVFSAGALSATNVGVARADYTISWCQNAASDPPFTNGGTGAEPWNDIRYECNSNPPVVDLDNVSEKTINGKLEVKTEGVLYGNHSYKVTMTTPTGLTISRIDTTLVSEPYNRGESKLEVQVGDDGGVFFSQPAVSPWTDNVNQALPAGDSTVTIGDRCVIVLNVSCFFASPLGILTVASLSLTLHDDEQPTLYLTGGELLLTGQHSGNENVTFSASAPNSGIAEVDAYLGSTLVGIDAYQTTQCSYTRFEPCPKSVSDTISVNTTKVADGSYPLVLKAYDASGNVVGVPWSVPITVANDVPPAGTARGPGPPNGHNATTKAQITYLGGQGGKITVADGQATSVSGRLTDQTGAPIPGATVDLLSQTVGSNAVFALMGHASTNASGLFTFNVPAGPSRVIRTGYRAFANESGYVATADLTENVTASTRLSVKPRRLRGRTFAFVGQIHAGNFPPAQQVEIQALIGSNWTHVTFAKVASNGHFKVRYRLKHHYQHVTFIFRAIPVASPIWPYEPQPSNLAKLHLL